MKMIIALLLISAFPVSAQTGMMQEDTITSGNWNEYHPALSRALRISPDRPGEWLVFERQTDDSSFIVAKMIQKAPVRWDSSEVIISRSGLDELQSRPDISLNGVNGEYGMIAWQKRTAGKWAIFFSTFSPQTLEWSPPLPLTNDTLDNVNVRLQRASGASEFVVVWQNGRVIRIHPSVSPSGSDTIAISNDDSTRFDIASSKTSSQRALLYTIKNGGRVTLVRIGFTTYPGISVTERDTLQADVSVSNPRFAQDISSNNVIFESQEANAPRRHIYLASLGSHYMTQIEQLTESDDSLSYRNASMYMLPLMTLKVSHPQSISGYEVMAAERYAHADTAANSSIVIMQGEYVTSIASAGYNRNPVIGGYAYPLGWPPGPALPIVWESNRSGKNHLYGMKYISQYSVGVEAERSSAPQFALGQNYPNPFNPSTSITFSIPKRSFVSLKIYDVMGRDVSTLVAEDVPAGTYSRQWNASGVPSGVYFYRLQAGAYAATKRLVVVK